MATLPFTGYDPNGPIVTVIGYASNFQSICYLDGYKTVAMLPEELTIQNGFDFPNLELIRKALMAYTSTDTAIAAKIRTITTLAHQGDLLSIWRDVVGLSAIPLTFRLCGQRKYVDIDYDMATLENVKRYALDELFTLDVPKEYRPVFEGQAFSTNFQARVTGTCGMVLMAAVALTV